ncbi:MAG: leucyl/phenylalanyl-tRNA--protein transferase [Bacteroidota bacterium]
MTPRLLLSAYASGAFPMADPEEGGTVYWYAPDPRAILPINDFHIPKTLRRTVRRAPFDVKVNQSFEAVIRACAEPGPGRETTWISEELIEAYVGLHRHGFAHSVECWEAGRLVGGLYGVALRGAFFGESMFHRATDASKVALVHLVERLRAGGFVLHDVQFTTPHLARFGAIEIPKPAYEDRLAAALEVEAVF